MCCSAYVDFPSFRKMATSREASLGKHIKRWKPIFLDCNNQSNYIDQSIRYRIYIKTAGGFRSKYNRNLVKLDVENR